MLTEKKNKPKFKIGDLVLFAGLKSEIKGVFKVPMENRVFFFYDIYNHTTYINLFDIEESYLKNAGN